MQYFKIFIKEISGNQIIRRFSTEKRPSLSQFMILVYQNFPEYSFFNQIHYLDENQNQIFISGEIDWDAMFLNIHDKNLIKIYMTEGKQILPHQIPPSDPFTENPAINEDFEGEEFKQEKSIFYRRAIQFLEFHFPEKNIPIPGNPLPSFITENTMNITEHKNLNSVELIMDLPELYKTVNQKAHDSLIDRDYVQAGRLFRSLLLLDPFDAMSTYNLACVEARQDNVIEALDMLRHAVLLGFGDLELFLSDDDLESVRNTEEYLKIVEEITPKI